MGSSSFWYIFATNGVNGFLLDLIRRPDRCMCRLALYCEARPAVLEETLPSDTLVSNAELRVQLGSFELTPQGVRGELGKIRVEADFDLIGREASFTPSWVPKVFSQIPSFRSHYGHLRSGLCNGVRYQNLPLVYSTYEVRELQRARWYLVSASQFKGSDLAIEICASRLFCRWEASTYVFFQGSEYKFTSVFSSLFQTRTLAAGKIVGRERVFSACLRSRSISLTVNGRAPLSSYAMLAREGRTEIHTTLFGTCTASITLPAQGSPCTLVAEKTCLLELKDVSGGAAVLSEGSPATEGIMGN